MFIFILFASTGVLFEGFFSLWVSLIVKILPILENAILNNTSSKIICRIKSFTRTEFQMLISLHRVSNISNNLTLRFLRETNNRYHLKLSNIINSWFTCQVKLAEVPLDLEGIILGTAKFLKAKREAFWLTNYPYILADFKEHISIFQEDLNTKYAIPLLIKIENQC